MEAKQMEANCKELAASLMPFSKIKYKTSTEGGPVAAWVTSSGTTVCSARGKDKVAAMKKLLKEIKGYSQIIKSGKIAKVW